MFQKFRSIFTFEQAGKKSLNQLTSNTEEKNQKEEEKEKRKPQRSVQSFRINFSSINELHVKREREKKTNKR